MNDTHTNHNTEHMKTPRTDEFGYQILPRKSDGSTDWRKGLEHWGAFARQLERELSAVTKSLLSANAELIETKSRCLAAISERDRLQKILCGANGEVATLRAKLKESEHQVACVNKYAPGLISVAISIESVTAERDAWKASHDNQVNLRRTLMDRPDLGDRAKRMQELLAERDAARADAAAMREAIVYYLESPANDSDPRSIKALNALKDVAETNNPGAPLLAELAQLREKVKDLHASLNQDPDALDFFNLIEERIRLRDRNTKLLALVEEIRDIPFDENGTSEMRRVLTAKAGLAQLKGEQP